MIAKFPGKCYLCGNPITVGVDHYDFDKKRSYHSECQERADDSPSDEQRQLADRLGFKHYEETRIK